MSFFEKAPSSMFRPMVSIHNEFYVEMLLEIDHFMERTQAISLAREECKDYLNDYIISRGEEHILDEEEAEIPREFLSDKSTGSYVLKIFEKYGWISVDHRGEDYKEIISLPYHIRLFLNFIKEIQNEETQAYFMIAVDTQLNRLLSKEDLSFSYMLFNNIYKAMEDLIMMLQKTIARVRDFYEHGLQEIDPQRLMDDYFITYYEEIVEKFVFPTVVDDSIKRFKGPVRQKILRLYEDKALLAKIQESASVYNKRNKHMDLEQIELMCIQIISHLDHVDELTDELIAQNEKYRSRFKQILLFQLNVDSNVLYDLNVILQNLNEKDEQIDAFVNRECNYHAMEVIEEEELADLRRKQRVMRESVMTPVDVADHFDEEDEDFERQKEWIRKFSDPSLIAYYEQFIEPYGVKSIRDLPIDCDDDYLRTILLSIQEDVSSFPYSITQVGGTIKQGVYELPLFNIERGAKKV